MSWIRNANLSPLQKLMVTIIKTGRVPRHVAFIMDGNRRYANKNKVEKVEGHSKGFDKLTEVLSWCLDLGVQEVTVYAFSIENFKRSKDEVDYLMDLAREKFKKLLDEEEKLMREGVNVRVIGDLSLVPRDVYELIAKAVCMTKNNTRVRLTVAFSYTAQNEIAETVRCISRGVKEGSLKESDISTDLLSRSLYTEDSDSPELLIRTSGEVRVSDFMLWQTSCAYMYFTPVLWPEFTTWDLLKAIFHYQRSYKTLNEVQKRECSVIRNERTEKFVSDLYSQRLEHMREAVR